MEALPAVCLIALVGDWHPAITAHRAIPRAHIAAAEQAQVLRNVESVGCADEEDGDLPAAHAVERSAPPFFVATLFQSERAALQG